MIKPWTLEMLGSLGSLLERLSQTIIHKNEKKHIIHRYFP
jgi:hypothetical protein